MAALSIEGVGLTPTSPFGISLAAKRPVADRRLLKASLVEIIDWIGALNVELAHYRAMAQRSDNSAEAIRKGCRDLRKRTQAERERLNEVVKRLPPQLQTHSRIDDVAAPST